MAEIAVIHLTFQAFSVIILYRWFSRWCCNLWWEGYDYQKALYRSRFII